MEKIKKVFLIGYMGTGKTSVAAELSALLGFPAIEMDTLLSARAGKSIPEIFAEDGETVFRTMETELLREIVAVSFPAAVISCGGGVPLAAVNRSLLKTAGMTVLLEASPSVLWQRLAGDNSRPLLKDKNSEHDLAVMLADRMPYYLDACDLRIQTDTLSPLEIAALIRDRLYAAENASSG